jgi:hypothetical protein
VSVPFQVGLQARFAIGPGRIRGLRAAGRASAGAPVAAVTVPNPIAAILGMGDSLNLSAQQVARLQVLSDSLVARARMVSDSSQVEAYRAFALRRALEEARSVLTPEQWTKLPATFKSPTQALND